MSNNKAIIDHHIIEHLMRIIIECQIRKVINIKTNNKIIIVRDLDIRIDRANKVNRK